jgi:hypothetical protein
MHNELANGDLTRLLQSIADHGIALISIITIRDEIIGLLPIAAVDLGLARCAKWGL